MSITYIQYHLLNLDGSGLQPGHQAAQMGVVFHGGHYVKGGRYLGYLVGDPDSIVNAVTALSPWRIIELSSSEALAWAEEVVPINTVLDDMSGPRYAGPAELDGRGWVVQPLSDTPWEV